VKTLENICILPFISGFILQFFYTHPEYFRRREFSKNSFYLCRNSS
jgi:hypothetical protein